MAGTVIQFDRKELTKKRLVNAVGGILAKRVLKDWGLIRLHRKLVWIKCWFIVILGDFQNL